MEKPEDGVKSDDLETQPSGENRLDHKVDHCGVDDDDDQAQLPSHTKPDVPVVLDWDGPDDPANPHNWSLLKRSACTFAVALSGFTVSAGSSLVTPAVPGISSHFNVSEEVSILSLSLYVIGLALGPTLAAPLSEILGRSPIYKVTIFIFMLFLMGAGLSPTIGGFLALRFLAGLAGSPCLAIGAGSNADVYPRESRAVPAILFIVAPFLGPGLAPVIGGFVAYYKGYAWTQYVTLFIGLLTFFILLPLPETYKPTILKRRAKERGQAPPPAAERKPLDALKTAMKNTIVRPVQMLFLEPIVFCFTLYNAFTFATLFGFFGAYPLVFSEVYGFNTWQNGLTFLGIATGVLLAAGFCVLSDIHIYQPKHRRAVVAGTGYIDPEHRLYPAMVGAFCVTIGLFWFAWTARSDIHWISPVLAGIPFAFGNLCLFSSSALYLIDVYGFAFGASAIAANGLGRYTLGAVFPLFINQMYHKLGIGWATSLLGFVSVAMIPIPLVFFKYGPKIRAKSKFNAA